MDPLRSSPVYNSVAASPVEGGPPPDAAPPVVQDSVELSHDDGESSSLSSAWNWMKGKASGAAGGLNHAAGQILEYSGRGWNALGEAAHDADTYFDKQMKD